MSEGPPIRLSVTAVRDFYRCGEYYRRKRVLHEPEPVNQNLQGGRIVHDCYYYAWADPHQPDGEWRLKWILTGRFDPQRAVKMFKALWEGGEAALQAVDTRHLRLIEGDLEPWSKVEIGHGKLKALQADDPITLFGNWGAYFLKMLEGALDTKLPFPIKEIEREIVYDVAGVQMLGFLDLVLNGPAPLETIVDLKSGYYYKREEDVLWDEQMALYYLQGPDLIYYWHLRSGKMVRVARNVDFIDFLHRIVPEAASLIVDGVFPHRWDQLACPRCPFFEACIHNRSALAAPDALAATRDADEEG